MSLARFAFAVLIAPTGALVFKPDRSVRAEGTRALATRAFAAAAAAVIAARSVDAKPPPAAFSVVVETEQRPLSSTLLAKQTSDWTAADFDWDSITKNIGQPPAPPPPPVDPKAEAAEKKAAERASADRARAEKRLADDKARAEKTLLDNKARAEKEAARQQAAERRAKTSNGARAPTCPTASDHRLD